MGWAEGLIGANAGPKSPFPVNDTAIKTVSGVSHPDDCDFHEWSWEAFVWATGIGTDGRARFTTLHNADELFGNKAAAVKGPKPLSLKPRDLKPVGAPQARSGDEAAQAGGGLIVDQNGQIVWYSTHMNDAYFNFVKANSGANYGKVPPTKNFPVGAAVFKASWKVVGAGDDVTKFYTEDSVVPMLIPNPCGGIMIDPSGATRPAKVALVGLHIVGVTVNHPEFVWATFEQNNNAPDLPAGMDPNSTQPVSSSASTFYAANTAANKCNVKADGKDGHPILQITDPAKQTVSPVTNIFRLYATGNACPARTQDIVNANTASQNALAQAGGGRYPNPKETVWANYKLIGTLWLNANTLKPNDKNMVSEGIGSVNLANATLETFFQGHFPSGQQISCFLCHNTIAQPPDTKGKNINLSHLILGLIPPPPNPTPTPTCTPATAPASASSSTPAASPTASP
jgi:hypothetical protein